MVDWPPDSQHQIRFASRTSTRGTCARCCEGVLGAGTTEKVGTQGTELTIINQQEVPNLSKLIIINQQEHKKKRRKRERERERHMLQTPAGPVMACAGGPCSVPWGTTFSSWRSMDLYRNVRPCWEGPVGGPHGDNPKSSECMVHDGPFAHRCSHSSPIHVCEWSWPSRPIPMWATMDCHELPSFITGTSFNLVTWHAVHEVTTGRCVMREPNCSP